VDDARLPLYLKLVYGLGDHSLNVALVALTMILPFYLTDVVEMRVGLAGLVPLVGRGVDAFSDVLMGQLSDRTRWKRGRRRPFLLIGSLPFALAFAAIWAVPRIDSTMLEFIYYVAIYVVISISMTVVAVPYQALMPDLTESYHERTSLATFRSVASLLGTLLVAVTFQPLVAYFGGDASAWAIVGALYAVWVFWPWFPIWWVTYESPPKEESEPLGLRGYRLLLSSNSNYRRLLTFYTLGRIAIDLPLALFLHFFTYVIGHPDYFPPIMVSFTLGTVIAMPAWLRLSRGRDKVTIYGYACFAWIATFVGLFVLQPGWPLGAMVLIALLSGAGYSAVDMMPWSMVADMADEDEMESGQRREGIFVGFFTFLRKLAGASSVAIAFLVLDLVGFRPGEGNDQEVLWTIRVLTTCLPVVFILASIAASRRYTLGAAEHAEIMTELEGRRGERDADSA